MSKELPVIVASPVWSLNGVNTFSANLVRGLRRSGRPARLLLTGVTYRERKPIPLPPDIPVSQLKLPAFATWTARRRALIEFLESEAPCIYLPNHDFLHSCVTSALSHRIGVVGIIHSDDAQHYDHAARMGPTWNAAVAVSDTISRRVREQGAIDESRLSVIPYGVPAAAAPVLRSAHEDLRILYAGRFDAGQKRSGDLGAIASALARRGVRFTLTIVGDGPERSSLQHDIARRGLADRVRLLGPVGNDRILEMCSGSDAFLLTSAYEGMPIAMLEAMGQGCVPFASEVESGVSEVIRDGENGFIVAVGQVDQFAERMDSFARSSIMRQRMSGEAWRTIAEGGYKVEVMIDRYVELFERVSGEMESVRFSRPGKGRITPIPVSLRERLVAPLWPLVPATLRQRRTAQ